MFTASSKLCEHNDTVRALGGVEVNPLLRLRVGPYDFADLYSVQDEP